VRAALIDPEITQIDRYLRACDAARDADHFLIDTHTHADHFSATQELARRLEVP
jgi:glyoxylase-like metal-dependent hydrolase (beta-lactamase superfamily II)